MKLTWLLLVSVFCSSSQEEAGVFGCEAQNVTVTESGQTILLTWDDPPSCSAHQDQDVLTYEVQVLIANTPLHHKEITVTPDHIGSTHSWNWTSLALECKSHSVKLRSRYKNHTSQWILLLSHGIKPSVKTGVFPKDKEFTVGSRATFCCVLPEGEVFNKMFLAQYSSTNMTTTYIRNRIYALTVDLNQPSKSSSTNVICKAKNTDPGTVAYIGYPPDVKDLQCETQDLQSVKCRWTVGRHSNLPKLKIEYQLLGRPCKVADPSNGRCSQEAEVDVGERNWTLTANNSLGKLDLSDTADLMKRVHMLPPEGVKASTLNARNVSLEWKWTVPQYYNLNLTCQVKLGYGHTTTENFGVGLNFSLLNDLIPNKKYNVAVRCGTAQDFWKWSDWSKSYYFHTKGDIPDALDVWMQTKNNQIIIVWKMLLANQSHGHIIDYEVTWAQTTERGQPNRTKVAHNETSLALSLDATEEFIVTVTARNINGSSPPSTITIPRHNPGRATVNPSRISGSSAGFGLSWSPSAAASCGYTVDWCPALKECFVEWLKVGPSETNASIFSENFVDGQRYTFSVHACTQGAPVLLERKEGYVREKRIKGGLFTSLKGDQKGSDFVVSWDPVPLRNQSAFIQGYVLYCSDSNRTFICSSSDVLEDTSLTAKNLKISSYRFTLKAKTAVGECGDTSFSFTLGPPDDNALQTVVISLVTVFGLLSLVIILCYRHWTCIKMKIYPPIPKPVLSSPGERMCSPLFMENQSEADIIEVAEVFCTEGAPINGHIGQDYMPFVFTQTPNGYSNQPLKRNAPPPPTLPIKPTPSESGFPSFPFRSVYPNPSYNLITQLWNQQIIPGPGLLEGKSLGISSDGYQPHDHVETFPVNQTDEGRVNHMSCESAYITLPQNSETFPVNQTDEDRVNHMSCESAYITLPQSPSE